MTPEGLARAVAEPVAHVGGAFMMDAATYQRGGEIELPGMTFYFAGRGGVLGDVEPEVVAAAFVYFPLDKIRTEWARTRAVMPPAKAAAEFAEVSANWGRRRLADFDGAQRLAELAERVNDAADVAARPLFAGWRAMARPTDAPGRCALALHVLREHRGGTHAIAVLGAGLTPLQAHLHGPMGLDGVKLFGWPQPYPDPAPFADACAAAEEVTNRLEASAYDVLDVDERDEFARLMEAAASVALPG